jgi:hypothetical protein
VAGTLFSPFRCEDKQILTVARSLQVNGDYNTRCIKPERDVVLPAVTKHTKSLFDTFKTPSDIAPVSERKHLAFFAGGVRGFGAIARTKIGCGRTGQDADSAILYQQFSPGKRYLGTLNASKFCLLPRGIPAWFVSFPFFSLAIPH